MDSTIFDAAYSWIGNNRACSFFRFHGIRRTGTQWLCGSVNVPLGVGESQLRQQLPEQAADSNGYPHMHLRGLDESSPER